MEDLDRVITKYNFYSCALNTVDTIAIIICLIISGLLIGRGDPDEDLCINLYSVFFKNTLYYWVLINILSITGILACFLIINCIFMTKISKKIIKLKLFIRIMIILLTLYSNSFLIITNYGYRRYYMFSTDCNLVVAGFLGFFLALINAFSVISIITTIILTIRLFLPLYRILLYYYERLIH